MLNKFEIMYCLLISFIIYELPFMFIWYKINFYNFHKYDQKEAEEIREKYMVPWDEYLEVISCIPLLMGFGVIIYMGVNR